MKASVEVVHVYANRTWIESDQFGGRHVMVQSEDPGSVPFCYASFHYDYTYTSNARTFSDAESLAKSLGAQEPIEHRTRDFAESNAITQGKQPLAWLVTGGKVFIDSAHTELRYAEQARDRNTGSHIVALTAM